MRRDVIDDPHACGFQLRHRIGRRRFDQVDLSGQQRVGSGQRFRHRDQDQLVDFRDPLLVPVIRILRQFSQFARHQFRQLERSGARRLACEFIPVLAEFFVLRGAGHQKPQHLIREERIDGLGGDLDRGVVDPGVARNRRQAGFHLGALALVELRGFVVEDLVEIPDHRVGIEVAAVMEFHALAERKSPLGLVVVVDLPFGGKAGYQFARPIRDIHFPGDQRVVNGVGGELIGARATIRLARRQGNIGHRNPVSHHRLGARGNGGQADADSEGQGSKDRISDVHELGSTGQMMRRNGRPQLGDRSLQG